MAHRRDEPHAHEAALPETGSRLRLAFLITASILIAETVGGLLSNSLALLSDAGHVFTDALALGLAWFASVQALRPATPQRTYGFHRAGILAALANAITLLAVSLFITWEAIQRLQSPEPVDTGIMLAVALLGMAANLYVAFSLHKEHGENLNVRSALLHVIGDILASAAVIAGGVVIYFTGWYFVDPLLSVLIALIIVGGAWSVVLETINILMEGAPSGINLDKVLQDVRATPGVVDAHDIHVWSLASGIHAMSGHVVIEDRAVSESAMILEMISQTLDQKYGINHSTIQFEHRKCGLACALFEDHLECR
ncbi:MAG: cation diffusion facilitator family transporter [Chloroflexota bacterium]